MPKALSFRKPRSTTSYSAMLFVVRNSSLATYRSYEPFGGVNIAAMPATAIP
jgi:hypothetical protein